MSDDDENYEYDDDEYVYEEDGEGYDDVEEDEPKRKMSIVDDLSYLNEKENPPSQEKRRSHGSEQFKKELSVPEDGHYVITDIKEIQPLMLRLVDEVSNLLDVDENVAQTLLQHYKWDKERLIDSFFADSEKVSKACGVELYCSEVTAPPKAPSKSSPKRTRSTLRRQESKEQTFLCKICCDDHFTAEDCCSLGCLHRYCKPCYAEYLRIKVNDGPVCIITRCPEPKCTQIVTKNVFHALLNKDDCLRYDNYFIRNFIEISKHMKYCPAARCDKVAIGSGVTTIRCSCTNPFCFKCGEEAHEPSSCAQLAEWTEKCMNESETANWILANTRKCPTCTTRIEKNQGCNYMTCSRCKYEFCWICMGDWKEHGQNSGGFYKCNKFDPNNGNEALNEAQKAKAELDRYLHYYQRYHGHDVSLKFATNQRAAAEKRMVEQQEAQKSSWIDVQFLKQAAEQVIDCRRVLKYTYVLGFTLKDGSAEKSLFEHHQEMLEKNTDKLQEYTEKDLDLIDRTQVINLTRVTEKFMSGLLSTITGGIVSVDDSFDMANYTPIATPDKNNSSSSSGVVGSDSKK